MNPILTVEKDGKRLEIMQDHHAENPRAWDNVTTMALFHKRYDLGDDVPFTTDDFNGWHEMREYIEETYDVAAIKPVYLLDHSGLRISTTSFRSCDPNGWDSVQIGFVFITEEQTENMLGDPDDDRLNEILESEVDTLDKYLRGDVYRFAIKEIETCDHGHEHTNAVDACGGFYGTDWEENGLLEYAEGFNAEDLKKEGDA